MSKCPIYVYDFTLSIDKSTDDHLEIIKELETICKHYCFQKEEGHAKEETPLDEDYDMSSDNSDDYTDDGDYSDEESIEDSITDSESNSDSDNTDYSLIDSDDSYDTDGDNSELELNNDSSEYDSDDSIETENSERSDNEEGYLHYQGRISLMKKKRVNELKNLLLENNYYLSKAHFSPTVNNNVGQVFYCMKLDTRIDGPWTDKDEKEVPIPKQLAIIENLYPYQQEIIDRALYCWSPRNINVLIDTEGCKGKSTLALHCAVHKIGKQIPSVNSYLDIMQCVMSMPISGLYFIDMPRAINKNKLIEFYGGIESIKNGYCFDFRYKYTEKYFNSPEIWIFSNKYPQKDLMSRDRWKYWCIENNELFLLNRYNSQKTKGPEIVYPEVIDDCEESNNDSNDEFNDDETPLDDDIENKIE